MKRSRIVWLAIMTVIAGGIATMLQPSFSTIGSKERSVAPSTPDAVGNPDKTAPVESAERMAQPNAPLRAPAEPTNLAIESLSQSDILRLYECGDAPDSEAALRERLNVLEDLERQEQRDYQKAKLEVAEEFHKCGAIPSKFRQSRIQILAAFADLGDDEDKLRFVNEGMPSQLDSESVALYQEKAREYLNALLEKGNAAALRAKAIALSRGSAYPRDPGQAYSYMFAYAIAEPRDEQVAATLAMVESAIDPRVVDSLRAVGSELATCCTK